MLSVYMTFAAAITLSAAAAYYSIIGLVAIFSGSKIAVGIMAFAMEYAKIVTTVWLHKHWREKHGLMKYYLSAAVFVLMVITSMGIYGFLSKSYLASSGDIKSDYVEIDSIKKQIQLIDENIKRNENALRQLDAAVNSYIDSGKVSKGLKEREKQTAERTSAVSEISRLSREKQTLNENLLVAEQRITKVEVEVGAAKYIAELIYGKENSAENLDNAIRWVIFLLIFVFDPLAILLMIATQISYDKQKNKTIILENSAEAVNFEHVVPVTEKTSVDLSETELKMRERIKRKKDRDGSNSKTM